MRMFATSITHTIFERLHEDTHNTRTHKTWTLDASSPRQTNGSNSILPRNPSPPRCPPLTSLHLPSPPLICNVNIPHHFLLSYPRRCTTPACVGSVKLRQMPDSGERKKNPPKILYGRTIFASGIGMRGRKIG